MPKEYPRFLTPDSKPFDPLELVRETENIVTRKGREGLERKYTAFYPVGVYGGIATAYGVGCCFRCFYCWVDWSRDFPEKYGRFYSPKEAFEKLKNAAKEGIQKLRISGCEPTLGKEHLLSLLEHVEESNFPLFILETNGILLGADKDYVRRLSRYSKVHVRVSFKAGTPEGFQERTGAIGEFCELPFKALKYLLEARVSCHAAAMTDPRVMGQEERLKLIKKLEEIDPRIARNLEEERIDPYDTTKQRLEAKGVWIKW